jgi:hypothetical protein
MAVVLTYVLPTRGQKAPERALEDQIHLLEESEGNAYLALDERG